MKNQCGITVLELIVAVTIAGIVMTLGFSAYGNLINMFSRQSRSADDLRHTIITQKSIERVLAKLMVIDRCSDREVTGFAAATGKPVQIRLSGNTLFNGADTAVSGLKRFVFELRERYSPDAGQNAVLLWDGTTVAGGWVGGAIMVKRK